MGHTIRTKTLGILLAGMFAGAYPAAALEPIEELGDELFEDEDLSINRNQSCAACHDPEFGKTGGIPEINAAGAVYEGSILGRFGDRKPPSSAYATLSPIFHFSQRGGGQWVGGNFWDGRATGEKLGNPAADQAQGPFLNPAEQALPDPACVIYRVSMATYAPLYAAVWGPDIFGIAFPPDTDDLCGMGMNIPLDPQDRAQVEKEYDQVALSIAAYEDSPEVNQFSSKFDAARQGRVKLTSQEQRGFALFQGKGRCGRCHPSGGRDPVFTDFTYDNLGVPSNPLNPALLADPTFRDPGLAGFLERRGEPPEVVVAELGKMKVPTLRNVAKRPNPDATKAYTHNGYFKTLEGIVNFYNTRDVKPECPGLFTEEQALSVGCWPPPEIPENVNDTELGDLGLSPEEEAAIVAFLTTLSDGFVLPPKHRRDDDD